MKFLEKTGRDRSLAAADVLNNWGLVHYRGDIRRAEPLYRRSLELHRAIEGTDAVGPIILHNYAGVLAQLARYSEAESVYEEAIRAAHDRELARVEVDASLGLACVYAEQGRVAEAAAAVARVEPHQEDKVFQAAQRRAFLAYARGLLARARGDATEARSRFLEAVRLYEEADAKFIYSVFALTELARSEIATGHLESADAAARRALALAESLVEKDSPSYLIGLAQDVLGEVLLARREPAARATLAAAVSQLEQTLGADHPATLRTRRLADGASR